MWLPSIVLATGMTVFAPKLTFGEAHDIFSTTQAVILSIYLDIFLKLGLSHCQ